MSFLDLTTGTQRSEKDVIAGGARGDAELFGDTIECLVEAIEAAVLEEGGEEGAEGAFRARTAGGGDVVERADGVVEHARVGVEREEADKEALRLGRCRVGLLLLEEALDEVRASGGRESADGEAVEEAVAIEGRGVGGGEEEVGKAVRVGLGADGGLGAGDGERGFGL